MLTPKLLLVVLLQWAIAEAAQDCQLRSLQILGSMYGVEQIDTKGIVPKDLSTSSYRAYYQLNNKKYVYKNQKQHENDKPTPKNTAKVLHISNQHRLNLKLVVGDKLGEDSFKMSMTSKHHVLTDSYADIAVVLNMNSTDGKLFALNTTELNSMSRMSFGEEIQLGEDKKVLEFAVDRYHGHILVGGTESGKGFLLLLRRLAEEYTLTPYHQLRSIMAEGFYSIIDDIDTIMKNVEVQNAPKNQILVKGEKIEEYKNYEKKLKGDIDKLTKLLKNYYDQFKYNKNRSKRQTEGKKICVPNKIVVKNNEILKKDIEDLDKSFKVVLKDNRITRNIESAINNSFRKCYDHYDSEDIITGP